MAQNLTNRAHWDIIFQQLPAKRSSKTMKPFTFLGRPHYSRERSILLYDAAANAGADFQIRIWSN